MENYTFFPTFCIAGFLGFDTKNITEDILKFSKETKNIQISNQGGYQGHDYFNEDFVNAVISVIPRRKDKPFKNPKLYSWVNINKKNNYNTRHVHLDTRMFLSGVYYAKVPENSGNIRFYDPRGPLMQAMSDHDYFYDGFAYQYLIPKDDMIIFFPSWLEHDVEPNNSDEDRISIAFNIFVDFEKVNPI
jgi:hypothetical protein